MTLADIETVTQQFVAAAVLARESGFDAVELHLGHGYLLSQFLSPATNRRTDEHGGTLAARCCFPLAVVERVRAALPPGFPVLAKVNLRDGFRGGLELADSVQLARWLAARGADASVLSGGFVSRDAFYLFRGERPLRAVRSPPSATSRRSSRSPCSAPLSSAPTPRAAVLPPARP